MTRTSAEQIWSSLSVVSLRKLCEASGVAIGRHLTRASFVEALCRKKVDPKTVLMGLTRPELAGLAKKLEISCASRDTKFALVEQVLGGTKAKTPTSTSRPSPMAVKERDSAQRRKHRSSRATSDKRVNARPKVLRSKSPTAVKRRIRAMLPELDSAARSMPAPRFLPDGVTAVSHDHALARHWHRCHRELATWLRQRLGEKEVATADAVRRRITDIEIDIAQRRQADLHRDELPDSLIAVSVTHPYGQYWARLRGRELETLRLLVQPIPRPLAEQAYGERLAIASLLACVMPRVAREHGRARATLKRLGAFLALEDTDIKRLEGYLEKRPDPAVFARRIRSPEVRRQILAGVVLAAIQDGDYRPTEREALRTIATLLGVPWSEVEAVEAALAVAAHEAVQQGAGTSGPKRNLTSKGRNWKVPLAVLAGAVMMAATGGAAAPAIGGAIGWGMGLSGAAATNAGLAALGLGSIASGGFGMAGGTVVVSSLLGAGGAYKLGRGVARRTGGLKTFAIGKPEGFSTHVWVGVSGFLTGDRDFTAEWAPLRTSLRSAEVRAVEWEPQTLRDLGKVVGTVVTQEGFKQFVKALSKHASKQAWRTLGLPFAMLQFMGSVGNPWHVAMDRSGKAGPELAHYLRERVLGKRPVSLIGHSLGGNLILTALLDLAETGDADLVHDVVLLGAAASPTRNQWEAARSVVSGRLVNAFCQSDAILAYLYRAAQLKSYVAGLEPASVKNVDDLDVTALVGGHTGYRDKLPAIFERIAALPSPA